jgi:hypothetical protein
MEISIPPLGKVNLRRVGKHILIDDFGRFEANAIRDLKGRCVGWRVEDKLLGLFTQVKSRAEVGLLIYTTMSKELPVADRENIHKKLVSIANSFKETAPVGGCKSVPPNSFDYCHMFGILDALVTLGYISRASSNYAAPYYTDLQFWMDKVFSEVFAS